MGKIKLSISSENVNNSEKIIEILKNLKVTCQVKPTFNVVETCRGEYRNERGAVIIFYDLREKYFKEEIWPILKDKLKLKCGFVETENYKGCIMDWPRVFRKTKCPGDSTAKD